MRHTRWMRVLLLAAVLGGCGSTPTTASATPSPTPTATPVVTPTPVVPTSPAVPTAAATAAQLQAVADAVYPACTPSTCPGGGGSYTTCDAGHSGSNVYSACPLTARLAAQLNADTSGGAGDPLGGGQDPVWQTRSITGVPSSTGGVAHVVLGFTGSSTHEAIDLVIVAGGGGLAVDDLYCAGSNPSTSDAYAPGWDGRATCSG